jgi:hypothetical protein
MPFHAQRQRLDPLQQQETIERRNRGPEIPNQFCPQPQRIAELAELLPEHQAVVARVRLVELRPAGRLGLEVEAAAVDDDAADSVAVPGKELRGRMHHQIRAMIKRPEEIRRGNGTTSGTPAS